MDRPPRPDRSPRWDHRRGRLEARARWDCESGIQGHHTEATLISVPPFLLSFGIIGLIAIAPVAVVEAKKTTSERTEANSPEEQYYYTDAISDNAVKFVKEHAEGIQAMEGRSLAPGFAGDKSRSVS